MAERSARARRKSVQEKRKQAGAPEDGGPRRARAPGDAPPWGARTPPARLLRGLRERLEAAGFSEAGVAARLGVPHPAGLALERYPIYRARLRAREPLDVATDLFLLQGEAGRAEAEALLGQDALAALLGAGVLVAAGRGRRAPVAAAVSIYPCAGALIATDHRWRPEARAGRAAPREPVMYLGGDSYALAYLAPRRPARAALDLCTGSGVHAILACRQSERVVAVDLTPRALAFGRFNAALNEVPEGKIEWRRGDLYGPLADGEKFDLVLANPPFVPSPHAGRARIGFRDAGPSGEDVLARLLAGLPARLARDGTAAVVSVFAEPEDEPYGSKVDRWLPRGADFGALLLRLGADRPEEYALAQTRRPFGDTFAEHAARHARWLETLRRARIRRLSGGVLALRARAGPAPPWWRAIDVPQPAAPAPEALESAWRACEAAHAIVFADDLLDRPARTPPDLVLSDEFERGDVEGAPALLPRRHRARAPSALLGAEVGISPELRIVLGLCDGARTLRAVLAEVAGTLRTDAGELAERLFADLREFVARGLCLVEKA